LGVHINNFGERWAAEAMTLFLAMSQRRSRDGTDAGFSWWMMRPMLLDLS
jgi:hypothetical protein